MPINKWLLGLGLILALLPTYLVRFTIFGLPTTFLEVILVIFLLSVLVSQYKQISSLKKLGALNSVVLLFVLSGIISTLISPEPIKALGQLKALIIEPVLFFYACALIIKKESDLKIPLTMLLSSSLIISLFGLIQHQTLLGLPLRFWGFGEGVKRIVSVFEYPNALALYLGPLLAFFLALIYSKSTLINRKLLFWTTGMGLIALVLTFSRGAWLAVLAVLAVLIGKKFSWKIAGAVLIIIIIAIVFLQSGQRFSLSDTSSQTRIQLYQYALTAVLANPLLGNGLHGFEAFGVLYPHNIFLNFWLELGLLGMLAFFGIITLSLKQYKIAPTSIKLAAAMFLLAVVVHGLVDVPYFKNDLSILFWFMISIFYLSKNPASDRV
ncbi:MAG: O-antigen ligase family protein [Candidatus Doudnabacteria bacterium]|nr:O-antigen ligase family protein [Candidatus Doudnabacteria bacterium]